MQNVIGLTDFWFWAQVSGKWVSCLFDMKNVWSEVRKQPPRPPPPPTPAYGPGQEMPSCLYFLKFMDKKRGQRYQCYAHRSCVSVEFWYGCVHLKQPYQTVACEPQLWSIWILSVAHKTFKKQTVSTDQRPQFVSRNVWLVKIIK